MTQTATALPGAAADVQAAEPEEQWDIGILYVSGKHVDQQSAKDLDQLRCSFAYCINLRHLEVHASRIVSRSSSRAKSKAKSGSG